MSLIRFAFAFLVLTTPLVAAADKQACVSASTKGQEQRIEGKLLAARASFRACTEESCPTPVRSACAGWLEEVEKAIPTIVIAARDDEGADSKVAVVRIDGRTSEAGRAIEIDPGEHTIEIETATGKAKQTLKVAEGEKNRLAVLVIAREKPPLPSPPKLVVAPTPKHEVASRGAAPWIFGGIGAAGIVSFIGFGASAYFGAKHLRDTCAGSCTHQEVQSVRTRLIVSDVSLGIGVVAGAISTWLFLEAPKETRIEGGPGTAGLSLVTTF